jgi:hypothetical protein
VSEQFEKEERYVVLKINKLSPDIVDQIKAAHASALVECVVVEHDWPEHDIVWEMIKQRVNGSSNIPSVPWDGAMCFDYP